jgi:methylamine utilization protein MauE
MASSYDFVLLTVNSVVAATLVQAGLSKIAVPSHLRHALAEVGAPEALAATRAIRLYAGIECVAGIALLFAVTRQLGAVLVIVAGLVIVGLGGRGAARRSVEPCGCFGNPAGRPLGLTNVVIGALLVAAGAANVVVRSPTGPAALLGTALALLLLCLFINRAWAWPLVRPRRGIPS